NLVEEVSEQRAERTSGSFQSGTEGRGTEEAAQNEALSEHEAKRKSSSLQSGTEERGTEEAAAQDEALHPDVDENRQEDQDAGRAAGTAPNSENLVEEVSEQRAQRTSGRAAGTAPNAENLVEEVSEQRAQRTSGSFLSGTEGRRMEEAAQHEALSEHAACTSEEHRIKGADRCSSPTFDALAVQAQ
ncbi:unnamed protein product, partial [Symbiodinium microadriaticum]